jgi:putative SOS response-associated peptidase YedK
MCVNYITVSRQILYDVFDTRVDSGDSGTEWPDEAFPDYLAPIIRSGPAGQREALVASYGMVPKRHIAPGAKRYSTVNARAESAAQLPSYAPSWKAGRFCLIPMHAFYEPNWETGRAVRWKIEMADQAPFAVAGLYRSWFEADGRTSFSFTQLTINADADPLMSRFHKPGDEKRSLVIVPRAEYDGWLECTDVERARRYLTLYRPELMAAAPAPSPGPASKSGAVTAPLHQSQLPW